LVDRRTPLWYTLSVGITAAVGWQRENTVVDKDEIKAAVLDAIEVSLEAQLKAIKRLRAGPPQPRAVRERTSQIQMVHDVLRRAGRPLHITEIIERVEKAHGIKLDRESIVSTLVKKLKRGDQFIRTEKNVFGLKGGE